MNAPECAVCGSKQKKVFRLKHKVFRCPECSLYTSDADFDFSFQSSLELGARETGLKELRFENFKAIIGKLKELKGAGVTGLEIGSGNGWWLKVCQDNGITCTGIEPERAHQDYHQASQLQVRYGFYPMPEIKRKGGYDFIIFNDVFEHIRDIGGLLDALNEDLAADGLLIINLPVSDGFFYRSAILLHRLGFSSFLNRLWQFDFHSPHMNYFNGGNLKRLLAGRGFDPVTDFKLESLDFTTIAERIKADSRVSRLKAAILSNALRVLKPVIRAAKPDIRVFFFARR